MEGFFMEFLTLNTGIQIPYVGSGTNTFGKVDQQYDGEINDDTSELMSAIGVGYRHFDTAISYRNERVVGLAMKQSELPREDFFITSKIPGRPEFVSSEKAVIDAVESTLTALDSSYVDLYLIHHPWPNLEEMVLVWKILEKFVDEGKIKALGVSNFNEKQLMYLIDHSRIKPAVNQVESNPGNWNHEIIEFSLKNQVIPEAWGPLKKVDETTRATLTEIGEKYDKSWAQVLLRYQIERNVIVIPKSHNSKRQKENLALFDFSLSNEERAIIGKL